MEKQKVAAVAEKIKAFAIALVGIVFFSWGTNYLTGEHIIYNVPRILLPVFNLFGHIGLAVGLLILGISLIAYGLFQWKKFDGKPFAYCLPVLLCLIAGVVLANVNFKSSDSLMKENEQKRETQIDEVRNSEKPTFKNRDLEKHLSAYNDLYNRCEKAFQNNDATAVDECEEEFGQWVAKIGDFIPSLNNDEKYELSLYYAKLAVLWSDLSEKYRE